MSDLQSPEYRVTTTSQPTQTGGGSNIVWIILFIPNWVLDAHGESSNIRAIYFVLNIFSIHRTINKLH